VQEAPIIGTHARLYSIFLPIVVLYLIMLLRGAQRLWGRRLSLVAFGSELSLVTLGLDLAAIFTGPIDRQTLLLPMVLLAFHVQTYFVASYLEQKRTDYDTRGPRIPGMASLTLGVVAIFSNAITFSTYFSLPFR
jgi:hypothetical protein